MNNKTKPTITSPLVSLSRLEFLLGTPRKELKKIAETIDRYYSPYDFHKNGTNKWRHIDSPNITLKIIQKRILKNILNKGLYLLPNGMTGGVSGKSIIENAKIHISKECIAIIDIKDCFPNTKHLKIYDVWKDYFGCGEKTVGILTQLTTFQDRLPQGAPTSLLLCNISLISIFKEIEKYTSSHDLNLSIFVDEITISGMKKDIISAIQPIINILTKNKYAVRREKIKIISSGFRQKTTGITLNRKLSIGRSEIKKIRNLIVETAKIKEYLPSNNYNLISGKITFAKQVSKPQGAKLEEFAKQLLINPLTLVQKEDIDEKRSCNKYNRDHKFIKPTILSTKD